MYTKLKKRLFNNRQFSKWETWLACSLFLLCLAGCTTQTQNILPTRVSFPPATDIPTQRPSAITPITPTDLPVTEEVETLNTVIDLVTEEVALITEEVPLNATPAAAGGTRTANDTPSTGNNNAESSVPPAETQESQALPEPVRYRNDDGTLFLVVTTINDEEKMPILAGAPQNEKYIALSTTLANLTGEPITVDALSLTLIDRQGERYPPVVPEDLLRAPLVEATLNGASTVTGLIRFAIPEDATPYLLEWCPLNDCDVERLQTRMP